MTGWKQCNFTTRRRPGSFGAARTLAEALLPITSHRRVQKAHLLLKALARLAPEEVQPEAQIQREGNVPVLHLRDRAARILA